MFFLFFLACTNPQLVDGEAWEDDVDVYEEEVPAASGEDADIYVIGDSVLDWFVGEGSVPEVVSESLDRPVVNAAVGGSHFLGGEDMDGIPSQYQEGPWGWLIMDGGANDLNDRCGCDDCDEVLDSILSEDGTQGVMADFATSVADSGVRVLIMGYYDIPVDAPDFEGCAPVMQQLSDRQSRLAQGHDGITFADASRVMDGRDLSMYDEDMIHPSQDGCQTLGTFLADVIAREDE